MFFAFGGLVVRELFVAGIAPLSAMHRIRVADTPRAVLRVVRFEIGFASIGLGGKWRLSLNPSTGERCAEFGRRELGWGGAA